MMADRAAKRDWPARLRTKAGSATPGTLAQIASSISISVTIALAVQHGRHRQIMAAAHLEVVEVVRGRDLDRAGAFFRVGVGCRQ